jgi:DNA-binding MarR family transcriptional regulator
MFVSGYVHRLLRHEARNLNIRWTALMVLKDLQVLGPVSQRILADIEQVSAPTMTVLIQQMEQQGWIQRAGGDDARVSLVSLTAVGRKELRRAGQLLRQRLEAELAGVPAGVLDDLQGNLAVLNRTIMTRLHGGAEDTG